MSTPEQKPPGPNETLSNWREDKFLPTQPEKTLVQLYDEGYRQVNGHQGYGDYNAHIAACKFLADEAVRRERKDPVLPTSIMDLVEKQSKQIAELREALTFYANNWKMEGHGDVIVAAPEDNLYDDAGDIARLALAKSETKEGG